MSTGIVICEDDVRVGTFNINTGVVTRDDYRVIYVDASPEFEFIQIPVQHKSFTPPHKKNRRGKFKPSGRG